MRLVERIINRGVTPHGNEPPNFINLVTEFRYGKAKTTFAEFRPSLIRKRVERSSIGFVHVCGHPRLG